MSNDLLNFKHSDYKKMLPIWQQVDDTVAGDYAVKAKGQLYLPKPNSQDKSPENSARYADYVFRAEFFNATGRTLNSMVGTVYRKPPTIDLPESMDFALSNIDGNGLGITQQSQYVTKEVLKKGRCGILVDYPQVEGSITKARAQSENLRPYAVVYEAQSIVNWITGRFGAITKLTTIVLTEEIERYSENFSTDTIKQYRVLMLDDDGLYCQKVFEIASNDTVNFVETVEPRDANGSRLNYIPFTFVGSENNDYRVDEAPMYDLSSTNLSHYRSSADNEESSYIVGQGSLFISTDNASGIQDANKCGLQIGSRSANFIGQDDTVQLLQADANNLPLENMQRKEQRMIMQGGRLITPQAQETAEAARIKKSDDNSVLSIVVRNVNTAYTTVINWLMLFNAGTEEDFIFQINNDLFFEKMTAQDRQAWIADVQQGIVSKVDYREALRQNGLLSDLRSDEDIEDDIDTDGPSEII